MYLDLQAQYNLIVSLLEAEEKPTSATIAEREARRSQIDQELKTLSAAMTPLRSRFHALPRIPDAYLVEWAEAVLQFYNLAFVVLDTTGVDEDSDIIRVYVADREGRTLFDHLVKPQRQQWANSAYTGIAQEQLDSAPSLADVWPFIKAELAGRYLLAFNLPFINARLMESAEHYTLPPITLIGEDLQEKARTFWGSYYSPKLADLCKRLGHELPHPATAADRVAGQYTLLRAMSLGITDVHVARESVTAGVVNVNEARQMTELDEGPF
jgi:DNA polymerase III epsilon subunit-like protein